MSGAVSLRRQASDTGHAPGPDPVHPRVLTMPTLPDLLKATVDLGASDLHITTSSAPQVRVDGQLRPLDLPSLGPAETEQLAYSVLSDAQKRRFEETSELDFSFGVRGIARFRCNVFSQRGAVAAVYKLIPEVIRSVRELGLPPVIEQMADRPRGLVLVTGPTGCGKSTTLAALIDKINTERHFHILTIEDPIEYLHPHKNCLVNQRELHSDTKGFAPALRAALREDPDVVVIGELRDLETIESALRIAETGHLTFATVHTNSAYQTVNRIIGVFPDSQQAQVRAQLSLVLEGIMCQTLLPKLGRSCRCDGGDDPDTCDPQSDSRGQDPPALLRHAGGAGEDRDANDEPVAGDAREAAAHLDGDRAGGVVDAGRATRHRAARRRGRRGRGDARRVSRSPIRGR